MNKYYLEGPRSVLTSCSSVFAMISGAVGVLFLVVWLQGVKLDGFERGMAVLAVPLMASGGLSFWRPTRWQRLILVLAEAALVGLLVYQARREWGHLHGGELVLGAWIVAAITSLLILLPGTVQAWRRKGR